MKKPIVDEESKLSWILQSWHESEAKDAKIPAYMKRMFKVARKYNVGIDSLKYGEGVKKIFPIWHHVGVQKNYLWNKKAARCLRQYHQIKTVEDLTNEEKIQKGCDTQERCKNVANLLIKQLPEKFNPLQNTPHSDNLDHTPKRIKKYNKARLDKAYVVFDPNVTERRDPCNTIRVFQKNKTYKTRRYIDKRIAREPLYREGLDREVIPERRTFTIGIAMKKPNTKNQKLAFCALCTENEEETFSGAMKDKSALKDEAELTAIFSIINKYKSGHLRIRTKTKTIAESFIKNIQKMEDSNYYGIKNPKNWKTLLHLLRQRTGKTSFHWAKRKKDEKAVRAKEIAKGALDSTETYEIDTEIDPMLMLEGVKLSTLTQKIAYEEIRKLRSKKDIDNEKVEEALEIAKGKAERLTGYRPSDEDIWKGLYKNVEKKAGDLLWKFNKQRLRCGTYFKNIPGWSDKQHCSCGMVETPEHIFFECKENGSIKVWKEVRKLWKKLDPLNRWIRPSRKLLPALAGMKFNNKGNQDINKTETTRYITFVSTAIWTIWKNRNNRIFRNNNISPKILAKSWLKEIQDLANQELAAVTLYPYKKRFIEYERVRETWAKDDIIISIPEKNPYGEPAISNRNKKMAKRRPTKM